MKENRTVVVRYGWKHWKVGKSRPCTQPGWKMGSKTVLLFDFDRTLIDDDSDRWVISEMGLTPLFNQLRPLLPWTSLMDRMVEELFSQGRKIEDIAKCLQGMPLHPHTAEVIKSAHSRGCVLKVVSDANQFYIETILKHHGLFDCFSEIITNPAVVDENGRLRIYPFNDVETFHGCDRCPLNMCKGLVMKRFQAEHPEARFIYLGDGSGDYCPILKLGKCDHAMPRTNFPLWKHIIRDPGLIEAQVHEWRNGEELGQILWQLIDTISCEDENRRTDELS